MVIINIDNGDYQKGKIHTFLLISFLIINIITIQY